MRREHLTVPFDRRRMVSTSSSSGRAQARSLVGVLARRSRAKARQARSPRERPTARVDSRRRAAKYVDSKLLSPVISTRAKLDRLFQGVAAISGLEPPDE